MKKCRACGQDMIVYEDNQLYHPTCFPAFSEPEGGLDPEAEAIRREFTSIIKWTDANSARSRQMAIGPSELGDPCDRRLGYRIAGIDTTNETDHWPAIVGTAIHTWLESAIQQHNEYTRSAKYLTELTVHPNDLVVGHSDLYHVEKKMIVDWKTVNTKNLAKFKQEGPPQSYITQINLYGLGQIRAGRPVEKVCLVCLPRGGWLSDMWVWVEDYNEDIALDALERVERIGHQLIGLDILNNPHRWATLEATPSKMCGWCPFYRQGANNDGRGADADGCPGW